MRDLKEKSFQDRQQAANQARRAMLERAKRPAADDPAVVEQRAARSAIVAARGARQEAKEHAAREQAEREAAERVEQEIRAKQEAREAADREVARLAEQKAQRDARYAARKKRKA